MNHIKRRISLLTAALVIVALPVIAEETAKGQMMESAQQSGKVQCLLVAVNSCERGLSPQSQIDKITNEIKKGSAVYSNDELRILNNELERAISDLNVAYGGGA